MRYIAAALLTVLLAAPAYAHRPNIKAELRDVTTGQVGTLQVVPRPPAHVQLDMTNAPRNGQLVMTFRLNAVPIGQHTYQLNGSGSRLQSWPLGVGVEPDVLEVSDIRLLDQGGHTVAVISSLVPPAGTKLSGQYFMTSALAFVLDTASDVGYTRGGDTTITRDGRFTVGFDALRSRATNEHLNNIGNYAEIEYVVNGGAPIVRRVFFDVRSGKSTPNGRPGTHLHFTPGDVVEVRRVDVFDALDNKFATMGVRIGAQGHYADVVP
jgi:hypothetical protein